MKKITLLFSFFLTAFALQAQVTITHSNSQEIVEGTITCPAEPTSFMRSFNLMQDFNITTNWVVTQVSFGVEQADDAPVQVNLYTAEEPDPTTTTLTPIYSGIQETVSNEIVVHEVANALPVAPGLFLVVEIKETIDGTLFKIGSNQNGETAPSYLSSLSCGAGAVSTFGATNHFVVNVTGDSALQINTNVANSVVLFPNPVANVLNIQHQPDTVIHTIVLFDMLGNTMDVAYTNDKQVVLEGISPGLYLVQIETSKGVITKKIIKQ